MCTGFQLMIRDLWVKFLLSQSKIVQETQKLWLVTLVVTTKVTKKDEICFVVSLHCQYNVGTKKAHAIYNKLLIGYMFLLCLMLLFTKLYHSNLIHLIRLTEIKVQLRIL